MGSFGRLGSKADLPADEVLISLIKQAVALNDQGVKVAKKKPAGNKELVLPDYLTAALKKIRQRKKRSKLFRTAAGGIRRVAG